MLVILCYMVQGMVMFGGVGTGFVGLLGPCDDSVSLELRCFRSTNGMPALQPSFF